MTATSDLALSVAVIGKILATHGGSSAAYRQLVSDVDRVIQELLTAEATGRAAVRALHAAWTYDHKALCPDPDCDGWQSACVTPLPDVLATDTARAWLATGG